MRIYIYIKYTRAHAHTSPPSNFVAETPFVRPSVRASVRPSVRLWIRSGGGGGGRNAKFGTGEKPRSDTFHYLMRGTWLGARQLSRSCVFHLDNYLGPSRVSHVDYVVQKNARGNVNGATTLAMQKLNAITVSIYLYIYVCVCMCVWDIGKKTVLPLLIITVERSLI